MKHTTQIINLTGGAKLLAIDVANSKEVQVNAIVRAGFLYAPKNKYELPHLLEHLCFDGNKKYSDPQTFSYQLESLGIYSNAYTSSQNVRYHFDGHIDDIEKILELIFAQIDKPLFLEKYVKQEKEVITNENNRYSKDDDYLCWLNAAKTISANAMSAEERTATLASISRDDINTFHNKTHVNANTYFLVSGDIKSKLSRIEKCLNTLLGGYRNGDRLKYQAEKLLDFQQQVVTAPAIHKNLSHFDLTFIHKGFPRELGPALRIFNCIYNIGIFSRMHFKARSKGLTYGTSSSYYLDRDNSGFTISDKTAPEKLLPLFTLAVEELADIVSGNFTHKEFTRAQGFVTRQFETGFSTPGSLANWYREYFSEDVKNIDPREELKSLKEITPEDVQKLKEIFFVPKNWVVSLVGNDLDGQKEEYKRIVAKFFS